MKLTKLTDKLDSAINKIEYYIVKKGDRLTYDDGTQSVVGDTLSGRTFGEVKSIVNCKRKEIPGRYNAPECVGIEVRN